jgi:ankyrin repeat protein
MRTRAASVLPRGPNLARLSMIALSLWVGSCQAQPPYGQMLHRAVLRGDLAEVRHILEVAPSSVRATDTVGMTALHFTVVRLRISPDLAATPRDMPPGGLTSSETSGRGTPGVSSLGCEAAPSLTSYDLDDLRRDRTINPLVTTIDYATIAELLISHGAPIDAKGGDLGLTPLHLAVTMGHLTVVRVLLDHGADMAATDRTGLTALHHAAISGSVATGRLLLDRAADANTRVGRAAPLPAFRDDTPLALATGCSHREFVDLLLEHGADPSRKGQDDFTPLHLASDADIAALLLAHGASAMERGYENRTPLHQAAMQGRTDVAALLLAHGADIEARDQQGRTPLLLTVDQPAASREMVAFLIRNKAQVNARSAAGDTPLQAALSRDREIVRMLLDAGANVNVADRYMRTPLHRAVEAHDLTLVDWLLARGAQVNARDTTSRTPLYYTWGGSAADQEIAALLRRHGGV